MVRVELAVLDAELTLLLRTSVVPDVPHCRIEVPSLSAAVPATAAVDADAAWVLLMLKHRIDAYNAGLADHPRTSTARMALLHSAVRVAMAVLGAAAPPR